MTSSNEQLVPVEQIDGPWKCFHCGDEFRDRSAARLHFGRDERSEVACIIKGGAEGSLLKALRDAEEEADEAIQRMHDESTDAAKAYHRQRCRHTQSLMAAEEAGYEKGLADARKELAALRTPPAVEPDEGLVVIARARTILRFLSGEGPVDGKWFGDSPPSDSRGNFWWRRHLKDIEAALSVTPSIRAQALDEAAPTLCSAFRTTVSAPDNYRMEFKFRTMDDLHQADAEWHALRGAK